MNLDSVDSLRTRSRRDALARLRAEGAPLRARELAAALGCSEAELVAIDPKLKVTALAPRWREILSALDALGEVMSLTRNSAVVSEITGPYGAPEFFEEHLGQVSGHPLDLRIFLHSWAFAFAVESAQGERTLRSVQFFDRHGEAVHKVYLRDSTKVSVFDALVARFAEPGASVEVVPRPGAPDERPDSAVDAVGLREAWSKLESAHQFFRLLKRYGVTRTQALRLAGPAWAEPLGGEVLPRLLDAVAAARVPVMFFVGNEAMLQIYQGTVTRVRPIDGWCNVFERDFTLHADLSQLGAAWRVRKPTNGGVITSFELFDKAKQNVLLVYGQRDDDGFDRPAWRTVIDAL